MRPAMWEASRGSRRDRRRNRLRMLALQYAPLLIFLVLIAVFGSLSDRFLTPCELAPDLAVAHGRMRSHMFTSSKFSEE